MGPVGCCGFLVLRLMWLGCKLFVIIEQVKAVFRISGISVKGVDQVKGFYAALAIHLLINVAKSLAKKLLRLFFGKYAHYPALKIG